MLTQENRSEDMLIPAQSHRSAGRSRGLIIPATWCVSSRVPINWYTFIESLPIHTFTNKSWFLNMSESNKNTVDSMSLTLTFITESSPLPSPPLPDQHYWLPHYHCRHRCVDLLALQRFWSPSLAPSLHRRSFHGGPHCFLSFIQLALMCLLCWTLFVSQIILLFFFLPLCLKIFRNISSTVQILKHNHAFKTALNNLCHESETLNLLILFKKKNIFNYNSSNPKKGLSLSNYIKEEQHFTICTWCLVFRVVTFCILYSNNYFIVSQCFMYK